MAEALISSILMQLATITYHHARQELKLVRGAKNEVRKLRSNFEAIHDVLEDAEEKQIVETNVKSWLDKLKEVSYDMEDVLDEWRTALSKLQTNGFESALISKKMVCSFISCFSFSRQVVGRRDIGIKIRRINEELDEIAKQKDRYHFAKTKIKQPRRVEETTSFADVSELKGREKIRDEILNKLTSEEGCIQTISIIGMGGIGKTALAQMVFDHVRSQESFDKTVWICVSDIFDQTKIAREILECLGCGLNSSQISIQSLLDKIRETTKDKKVFLVLDDMWTDRDQDWQPLKAAFQQCKGCTRILVTTRKESVVSMIRSCHVFHLELLSDEVCWEILNQVASLGREENECRDLGDVGKAIAKKCKGSPLVAKTLGSLLRYKKKRVEWEKILNSEFWELNIAEDNIFRPLLLSYYDLPSTIRRCLLYCAIFPKDYMMSRDELVVHWKVQGFLNFDDDSEMELKGEEYLDYLADRSFFQVERDISGNIYKCKMHDVIHDFLQFMTKDEFVAKEVNFFGTLNLDSSSKKARHCRITVGRKSRFPVSINGVEKLRSLLTIGQECAVTREALQNLFNKAKCLRLLEFGLSTWSSAAIVEEVPEEMGNLIHLRYLSFRWSYNLKLPESVCDLQNLQYLNLTGCIHLNKLPAEMEKLINLKYLYTSCCNLTYYPKGIGRLKGLRRLDRVVARVDSNHASVFSVGDLENLDLLCGDLQLHMDGNSINKQELERAKLHNKTRLTQLEMTLRTLDGREAAQVMKDYVIEVWNPPPNLRPRWIWYLFFMLLILNFLQIISIFQST